MKIIDISAWQPVFTVDDFCNYRKQGYTGVILKFGESGYEDENFRENFANAIKANMKVGLYIFSKALNINDAQRELDWVIAKIKEIGITNWHTQLGIWYDFEDRSQIRNEYGYILSAQEMTDIIAYFYDGLKAYGWDRVGCYIGYSLAWDNTYLYSQRPDIPIWVAQYNYECDYPNATIWQYTDRENVNGLELDASILLKEF